MRVALLGMGALVRDPVPWDDPDVEMWGLASRPKAVARFQRLDLAFEIHHPDMWPALGKTHEEHTAAINALGCPIVTFPRMSGIERQRPFPLADAIEIGTDLFTSSFDYMCAYAILSGAEWIGCYGFPMAQDDFREQRYGAHFWLGLAKGLGIDVVIPERSTLLHTEYRYGGSADPRCTAPPKVQKRVAFSLSKV